MSSWLEIHEAEEEIEKGLSGSVIEVSEAALEEAMGSVRADPTSAVDLDVCEGADPKSADGRGSMTDETKENKETNETKENKETKKKVVVFLQDWNHSDARVKLGKMKAPSVVEASVVDEVLGAVNGPKLVCFNLDVGGTRRQAVWVPNGSRLEKTAYR